jgi:radical SAM-linked protein
MTVPLPERLRLRYSKQGRIRFTSQRDTARVWERLLYQCDIPLRYSEGFSPHPLLAFGNALPTGAASLAEYIDMRLDANEVRTKGRFSVGSSTTTEALSELRSILNERTPEGIICDALGVLDGSEKSLQEAVACVRWEIVVAGIRPQDLEDRLQRALDAPVLELARERKGKPVTDDIRGNIESLTQIDEMTLAAELATLTRGVRPMELLTVVDPALTLVRATRTHQWISGDSGRIEPLEHGELATTSRLATTSVAS